MLLKRWRLGQMLHPQPCPLWALNKPLVLGWPKTSFGFFRNIKNAMLSFLSIKTLCERPVSCVGGSWDGAGFNYGQLLRIAVAWVGPISVALEFLCWMIQLDPQTRFSVYSGGCDDLGKAIPARLQKAPGWMGSDWDSFRLDFIPQDSRW